MVCCGARRQPWLWFWLRMRRVVLPQSFPPAHGLRVRCFTLSIVVLRLLHLQLYATQLPPCLLCHHLVVVLGLA